MVHLVYEVRRQEISFALHSQNWTKFPDFIRKMLKIDSSAWKYRERGSIRMVTPYDSETFRTTSQSITSSMDEGLLNRSSGFFIRYYLNHWWLRVSMSLFIASCIDHRLTSDTYVWFGNLKYFFVSSSWRCFQTARIDDLQKRGRENAKR